MSASQEELPAGIQYLDTQACIINSEPCLQYRFLDEATKQIITISVSERFAYLQPDLKRNAAIRHLREYLAAQELAEAGALPPEA